MFVIPYKIENREMAQVSTVQKRDISIVCAQYTGTVELCVCKCVTAEQVRTTGAPIVQECTMFRDGLVRLSDEFTVGDFTDIAYYLCMC